MSARNHYGIFKTKKAKLLAIKYDMDLNDVNYYIHNSNYITYYDVKNIVDNLWMDHFMYNSEKPLNITHDEYFTIYTILCNNYPNLIFKLSFA